MKKYLINGALALIVGFTYTSCKNNDVDYVPIAQQKTQAYAEAFKEMIGGEVDPNQDWGFETITISKEELAAVRAGSRAGTRAGEPEVVKKDQWENFPDRLDGNTVPPDVTTKEAEYVYQWFQNNPGLTIEGRPWSNFFLQQVYGTMNLQKKGIWHRYDQNYMANHPGATSNYYDEEFTDKGGMDYLTVGDGTTMTHVNDFNAESGGPWNIVYMKNSSALQFGYHSTWDNSERQRFKLAEIEVPGSCFTDGVARKGWYVGLSLLAEKEDNGKKVLGEQRKDYGDDWILKVVPGEGEPENVGGNDRVDESTITNATYERKTLMLQGRVFCEDLAKATRADIDFNDIVFDARIWRVSKFTKTNGVDNNDDKLLRYEAEICLLAAGGTIPANVANQDVHDLFGVGLTTMVNTVDGKSNVTIEWNNSNTTRPVKYFTFNMSDLIDDNNRKISLDLIPIEVMWTTSDATDTGMGSMKSVGHLGANVGEVPYKFCVPIGTPWASERNPITSVYSGFAEWAKNSTAPEPNWGNGGEFCYSSCPDGLPIDSKYVFGYTEEKLVSSTSTTTKVSEVTLWKGSRPKEFKDNEGNKALSFSATDIKAGDLIRIYGTKSNNNAHLVLKNRENGNDGQIIDINLTDLNGHKNVEVTSEMVSKIAGGTIYFTGRACTISQITKERTTVTTD